MDTYQFTGAKVEDAIKEAENELHASRNDMLIEVLDEGGSGLLGFGRRPAKIEVSLKHTAKPSREQEAEDLAEELVHSALSDDACPIGLGYEDDEEENYSQTELSSEDDDLVMVGNEPSVRRELSEAEIKEKEAKAVEYVKTILRGLGVHGTMASYINEEGTLCLDIDGEDIGVVIGRHGETLDAIQYLTNLVINDREEAHLRVLIDVGGYRERRLQHVVDHAIREAKHVMHTGYSVALPAMNSSERRQVHIALQSFRKLKTVSEGEEPYRHIVIYPGYGFRKHRGYRRGNNRNNRRYNDNEHRD